MPDDVVDRPGKIFKLEQNAGDNEYWSNAQKADFALFHYEARVNAGWSGPVMETSFDAYAFLASHLDLLAYIGDVSNAEQVYQVVTEHFLWRMAINPNAAWVNTTFDAAQYYTNYKDLQDTIGPDAQALARHYLLIGRFEGRVFDKAIGTDEGDFLDGQSGNDTLVGELGDDTMVGGAGTDHFVFDEDFGTDLIVDFAPGENDLSDLSQIAGVTKLSDLSITTQGNDTIIKLASGGDDKIILADYTGPLDASDFIFV